MNRQQHSVGADSRWPHGLIGGPVWPLAELLTQRVVFVNGVLDGETAARIAAELMTLDAMGSDAVDVYVECSTGTTDAALILMDTLDLMRAETRTHALGLVGGAAIGVLAVARRRTAGPSARFQIVEPRGSVSGTTGDLQAQLQQQQRLADRFHERVARATGHSQSEIANDLKAGRSLDAREAIEYGLIDSIAVRDPRAVDRG